MRKLLLVLSLILAVCFAIVAGHRDRVTRTRAAVRPEPANPVRAANCAKLISGMGSVYKDWKRQGDYVIVQIRDGFTLADLDEKVIFDGVIRCTASDGRTQRQGIEMVDYKDARTGKSVAHWTAEHGFMEDE